MKIIFVLLTLGTLLTTNMAFAVEDSQVLQNPTVVEISKLLNDKYGGQCSVPAKHEDIQWFCGDNNSPAPPRAIKSINCAFLVKVTCPNDTALITGFARSFRIQLPTKGSAIVLDTPSVVSIDSIQHRQAGKSQDMADQETRRAFTNCILGHIKQVDELIRGLVVNGVKSGTCSTVAECSLLRNLLKVRLEAWYSFDEVLLEMKSCDSDANYVDMIAALAPKGTGNSGQAPDDMIMTQRIYESFARRPLPMRVIDELER